MVDPFGDRRKSLVAAAAVQGPAADLRLDRPQQFLPGNVESDFAGRQTFDALAPIANRLVAEKNRVQVRHAQLLAKGQRIGAMARVDDDQRAELQHLFFVVPADVVFGQIEDGRGQDALFLQGTYEGIDYPGLLESEVGGVDGDHGPRRRGDIPAPFLRPLQKLVDRGHQAGLAVVGVIDRQAVLGAFGRQDRARGVQVGYVDIDQYPPRVFLHRAVVGPELRVVLDPVMLLRFRQRSFGNARNRQHPQLGPPLLGGSDHSLVVITILAANMLQENDLVAGEIDRFQTDLFVSEIVHPQAELAAKRLKYFKDPAVQADERDLRVMGERTGRVLHRQRGNGRFGERQMGLRREKGHRHKQEGQREHGVWRGHGAAVLQWPTELGRRYATPPDTRNSQNHAEPFTQW